MGEIGFAGAFLGGLVAMFSPCAAMLLPSFFAYAFGTRRALLGRTTLFYLGLLTTMVPLGVAAGSIGNLLLTRRLDIIAIGAWLVIGLGVLVALGVSVPVPKLGRGGRRDAASPVAIYLLGLTYGLASGCTGPILGSVLTLAAVQGNAFLGGVLLALFSLGMVVPLLVLALLWDRFDLGSKRWLRPRPVRIGPLRTTTVSLVSGLLFVALGVLLLVTDGTGSLGGILSADRQYDLENAVRRWAAGIPDLVVLLVVTALIGLGAWGWLRTRDRTD